MVVRAGGVMSGRLVVLFPVLLTLFFSAVLVIQIAASCAGNSSKSGAGKGILVEDGGANGTGGNADGSAGGEMLFLGSAGGESKGKDGYGESGKDSVHGFLDVAGSCDASHCRKSCYFFVYGFPYTGWSGACHQNSDMDKHGRPESCHGLRPLPSEGRASGRECGFSGSPVGGNV